MADILLGTGTMWSVVQTALAVLVYALVVNVFYQVISKRRMFANKRDVQAEEEIDTALAQAKDSTAEIKELAEEGRAQAAAGADNGDTVQAVVDAAEEVREAVAVAERGIALQVTSRGVWYREFRALVIFPLVTFLFFALLSANLIFIGSERPPFEVFSLSMGIILAVRMAAYINEATSHDLAKLLPLALLGFYLVEGDFRGISNGNDALFAVRDQWSVLLGFLVLVTVVEVLLRVAYLSLRRLRWNAWLASRRKAA